jgi:hypothetical protein
MLTQPSEGGDELNQRTGRISLMSEQARVKGGEEFAGVKLKQGDGSIRLSPAERLGHDFFEAAVLSKNGKSAEKEKQQDEKEGKTAHVRSSGVEGGLLGR